MISEEYTLIIPTYNRPKEFSALVHYLAHQKVKFPIFVLDSSYPEVMCENKKVISQVGLNIDFLSFSKDIPPFEKFFLGTQKVKTPFCSFCADDDVLVTDSIEPIIRFLKRNNSYVAAHGLYFSFRIEKKVVITDLVYTKDVLENDDPITRLYDLFQAYEAITYGVYKTRVLEKILSELQSLNSLLGRELLGGALTASMGKVKRLPLLYCGRSQSASHFYESWHPVEMLMTSPDSLYQEYGKYRKILVDNLKSTSPYSEEELYKLVDIIHFSYINEFFAPNILSYLKEQVMEHRELSTIMSGLWPIIIQNQQEKEEKHPALKMRFFQNIFKSSSSQESWLDDFEGKPFSFSVEFKIKIKSFLNSLGAPLNEVLTMSMGNYLNLLEDRTIKNLPQK